MEKQKYEPTKVANGLKVASLDYLGKSYNPEEISREFDRSFKSSFLSSRRRYSDLPQDEQSILCRQMTTINLLEDIASKVAEPEKVVLPTVESIEKQLEYSLASEYVVKDLQFQYPHLARGTYARFLDTPPEDVKSLNHLWFDRLVKYASHHTDLAEEVMQKAHEIYRLDNDRGMTGRRKIGAVISMFPFSLAHSSLEIIKGVGRGLRLTEEQAYQIAGTTKEAIEDNEKRWNEKSKKIIEREGLGREFEGTINLQVR
ncbi:MAG: hypothetical protein KJ674_02760 [Nanoarchaeota archaeon]|nr:hypothetical protein [Nanoarchaeota archaeon]